MSSAIRIAKRAAFPLLALLAVVPGDASRLDAQAPPAPPQTDQLVVPSRTPPVRVMLAQEELVPGDRARVLVRPRAEGYLLVLHADPAGRVRVLFPLDPGDTQRVPGAMQRAVPSRDGGASFVVASTTGDGAVLAAISQKPFAVAAFASGGHWNVRAFPRLAANADHEGELVAVVRRMAGGKRFDYAVAPYRVNEALPVIAYGGGYEPQGAYAGETAGASESVPTNGYYDYYDYYGDWLAYAGIIPGLGFAGYFSPCVIHHGGGGSVARGNCYGGGYGNRHGRPWGRNPRWRNPSQGTLAFPGNPSFAPPGPYGRIALGPRAIPAPASRPPSAIPASGRMVGVPARAPIGGGAPRIQAPMAAPRPIAPRMP